MRDLQKDLELCLKAQEEHRQICRLETSGFFVPYSSILTKFHWAAIEGWPEAVQRAMAAKAKIEQLKHYLKWALDYIAAENGVDEQGTPTHWCDYKGRPDKGYCEFHDKYWSAREILEK